MGTKNRKQVNVGNVVVAIIIFAGLLAWITALFSVWLFEGSVDDVWPFGLHVGWHFIGGLFLMLWGGLSLQDD